ncbi:exopolysaccharide transport family protein [Pinibacter soli]|uniref:Wzz/FepE/Etk N-terminal domain-containing protein n=1 Tax=Pinibacter soli TaxID=3044211 RepID=A0ABT6R6W9_9BACT|nr:Wzz/FepE/Etk N-terminal domain-containing protein [Pinibacter soli]MDI3318201.1 Wzz/FepE/Etk N-terminal domain-containing protein [Pinibacter soli]
MDLVFLLHALLKKKWVILICTIAGILAGLIFVFSKDQYYLSVAQYSTGFTMKQQVKIKDDVGYSFAEADQRFKNVIETFKSPVVIGMLSYELMLHDLEQKRPFRTLTEKEKTSPIIAGLNLEEAKKVLHQKVDNQELLVAYEPSESKVFELIKLYQYDHDALLGKLSVDRVQGTDYLNIVFQSENPELSAYVVNSIGREFFNFFTKINATRTTESMTKLSSLTQQKKQEYDNAVTILQKFREQVGSPNVGDRAKAAMEMMQSLTTQLNDNEGKLNSLKGRLSSVKDQIAGLSSGTVTASNANSDIIALTQKNRDLAAQQTTAGAVTYKDLQNQIDNNTRQIQKLETFKAGKGDVSGLRSQLMRDKSDIEYEITSLSQTSKSINDKINLYKGMAYTGGGDEVEVQKLQNEVDRLNTEYQALLGRMQTSQDVDVAPEINFKQTIVGQPAIKPEPGKKKTILLLCALTTFVVSSLVVIIIDFLDNSMRAPSIYHKNVKLKLLSTASKINLRTRTVADQFENVPETTRIINSAENIFIESVRKLRYEIENSEKKIVLFTSTKSDVGKSTLIEALAYSMSLAKKKLLLIDTNFPHNTLTEKFVPKSTLESVNFNPDKSVHEKGVYDIASKTPIPGVDIIGCKQGNFSPLEILPKHNLLEHLALIKREYDYIFIEGAGLNMHSDSRELSRYVEGIVVVFSADNTLNQLDKESLQFLKTIDNKVMGSVLNNIEKDNIEL